MIENQANVDYNINYPPPPVFSAPNCTSTDPEIFFPTTARDRRESNWPVEKMNRYGNTPQGKVLKPVEVAKQLCLECLHISPCRNYAMVNNIQFGIWGATTYQERVLLARLLMVSVDTIEFEDFDGESA